MNVSASAYGPASAAIAATVGCPLSESSQCTTSSRSVSATSLRSCEEKMTERSSRLAYTSTIRPRPAASADLRIDMTGVIPLPAANSRKSPSSESGQNVPAGGSTSSTPPGRTWSEIQLEA